LIKKLLTILAALGISGTALMSVVSCGLNPYTNPVGTNPSDPLPGNPSGPNDGDGG